MKKKHIKRFKKLIEILGRVDEKEFNMGSWGSCAIHHYIANTKTRLEMGHHSCFPRRKDLMNYEAVAKEFGISESEATLMFGAFSGSETEELICTICNFLKTKGVE